MDLICNWVQLRFCIDEVYQHLISYRFLLTIYLDPFNVQSYAHQRETTGSGIYSLQSRPFSKWELLLMERIGSQRERILSFMSSSL